MVPNIVMNNELISFEKSKLFLLHLVDKKTRKIRIKLEPDENSDQEKPSDLVIIFSI